MKTAFIILLISCFHLTSQAENLNDTPSTIQLLADEQAETEGLLIKLKKVDYEGVETQNVEFEILIVNLLLEEVFIEVTDSDEASISIERTGNDWGVMGTAGSVTGLPDNTRLLKRLHASFLNKEGEKLTCGCCQYTIKQSAKLNLSHWIGSKSKLSFRVSGYHRSNGKKIQRSY